VHLKKCSELLHLLSKEVGWNACLWYGLFTLSNPMLDLIRHYDFPVPNAFPHVVRTLANR
jgi:hypothetical protein